MRDNARRIVILGIISIGLFSQFLVGSVYAVESAQLTIVDAMYSVAGTNMVGEQAYVFYNISIVLHNAGNATSENTTIFIEDDQGYPGYRIHKFSPGEYKEFTFLNWPVKGTQDHRINISFYPKDDLIPKDANNSGSSFLILSYNSSPPIQKSTPGFETIVVVSGVVLIMLISKKIHET